MICRSPSIQAAWDTGIGSRAPAESSHRKAFPLVSRTYRHAPREVQLHQNRRREPGRKRLATAAVNPLETPAFRRGDSDFSLLSPIEAFKLGSDPQVRRRGLIRDFAYWDSHRLGPRHKLGEEFVAPWEGVRGRRAAAAACRSISRDPEQWYDHEVL